MARTPNGQTHRVRAALRTLEPSIRKAFERAIAKAAGSIDFNALVAAIESGNVQRAVEVLRINQALLFPLDDAIRAAYVAGGTMVTEDLTRGLSGRFGFDGRHERAESWMQEHGAELIEGIVRETAEMARKVITEGLAEGVEHRTVARQITGRKVGARRVGGFLGLNSDQTDSVIRARSILSDPDQIRDYFVRDRVTGRMKPRFKLSDRRYDAKVKAAIKEGRALTGKELDTVMEAHRSKALGYRGRVIAKNEAHTALAAGRMEAYQQISEDPEVETVTKKWVHGLSKEPRPDHLRLDGTVIDMDEKFEMDDGTLMDGPHDPAGGARHSIHCRCTAFYRVKMRRD